MGKKREAADVKKMLMQLSPGENKDKLYRDYQKKKMELTGLLIAIGLVSALSLHLSSRMKTKLVEGAQLIRNEWGAGDFEVRLLAQAGEWSREIALSVRERQYTLEEKEELMTDLQMVLPDLVKGRNPDLNHVETDLNLITSASDYPFWLSWESGNEERIGQHGKVNRKGVPKGGEWVGLRVYIKDREQEISNVFELQAFVLPEALTEEDIFFRKLEERLMGTEEERSSGKIDLPKSMDGKTICWEEEKSEYSILVFLLFVLAAAFAGRGVDRDLRKSILKRNKLLMGEYAGFVNMLRLYLMAGLTVKKAFSRIADDFAGQKMSQGKKTLYGEIKTLCWQLENGKPEEQVYQEWGQRCGETRYRRLSFLLGVHLKQGNSQLLQLLAQESETAQEDRRNFARKAGEEAGTKLLLPMVMMLAVVMMLVLLPAYLGFGAV